MKVVMWGAPWCSPCKKEKPKTQDICADLDFDFEYLSVDDWELEVKQKGIMAVPTWEVTSDLSETKVFTSYNSLRTYLLELRAQNDSHH